jgi:hypothetical protein
MRHAAPSIRTVSPRRSERTCSRYCVRSAQDIAFRPRALAALNPVPMAQDTRPGASSATVAIDDAVTMGCLVKGTATPVASSTLSVASAARASATHTSP